MSKTVAELSEDLCSRLESLTSHPKHLQSYREQIGDLITAVWDEALEEAAQALDDQRYTKPGREAEWSRANSTVIRALKGAKP